MVRVGPGPATNRPIQLARIAWLEGEDTSQQLYWARKATKKAPHDSRGKIHLARALLMAPPVKPDDCAWVRGLLDPMREKVFKRDGSKASALKLAASVYWAKAVLLDETCSADLRKEARKVVRWAETFVSRKPMFVWIQVEIAALLLHKARPTPEERIFGRALLSLFEKNAPSVPSYLHKVRKRLKERVAGLRRKHPDLPR